MQKIQNKKYAYAHEQNVVDRRNGSHDGKAKLVASVQANPWLKP